MQADSRPIALESIQVSYSCTHFCEEQKKIKRGDISRYQLDLLFGKHITVHKTQNLIEI